MLVQMSETAYLSGRVGFALRDPLPWGELVQIVQSGEKRGYEAVFVPEIAGREAFATLAGFAGRTSDLRLGTGVATIVRRRLATTAMGAATVQELSGGRLILGLGTGPAGPGSLERLSRSVAALRCMLAGETVELSPGERFRLTLEAGLEPVPIWIAALGPRAMRLAGEVADGVLLNWCPPERVVFARERIREGVERVGRDPSAVTVAVYVRACAGQELVPSMAALQAAAGQYATYPTYRRQFEAVGLVKEAAAAAAAFEAGRPEGVPEALVRRTCLLGEPREAALRLDAYRDAGADLPVVYPVPAHDALSSIMGTVLALAPRSVEA
jgi:5,10-methylenetetrahydromethanopterin reductase